MLVTMTNDTCVKYYMEPQAYKVVSTYAHEILGWTILSRLIHSHSPHLGWMNGDVQSDLATLAFNNREQLEDFHSRILKLKQEITLFGETVSTITEYRIVYRTRVLYDLTRLSLGLDSISLNVQRT